MGRGGALAHANPRPISSRISSITAMRLAGQVLLDPHAHRDPERGEEARRQDDRADRGRGRAGAGGHRFGQVAFQGGVVGQLAGQQRRVTHRQAGAHRPLALGWRHPFRELGHRRPQGRPRRVRRRGGPHRTDQGPDLLLLAVEEGVLLVGEVVGERPAGDSGRVRHRLDRHLVEAVLHRQAQSRLVHGLPGGFLLAFPESRSRGAAVHGGIIPRAGNSCAVGKIAQCACMVKSSPSRTWRARKP